MKAAERSRTGCGRCKARRVKCDEVWPVCGRCTRLKVSCPGPALHVRWSDKHQLRRNPGREIDAGSPVWQRQKEGQSRHIEEFEQATHQSVCAFAFAPGFPDMPLQIQHSSLVVDENNNWMNNSLGIEVFQSQTQDLISSFDSDLGFPKGRPEQQPPCVNTSDFLYETPQSLSFSSMETQFQSIDSPSNLFVEMPAVTHQTISPLDGNCLPSLSDYTSSSQGASPLTSTLVDYRTKLVEFYFQDAASILTVFDGTLNPFRTLVGRLWTSSNLLFVTIKSLSAVFLSNLYPQMAAVGASLRQEAIAILLNLEQDEMDEKDLLALFMIGGTASWFDVNDIGQNYFSVMKTNVRRMAKSGQISSGSNNFHFFKDLLVCWRMFLAFIDDHAVGDDDEDDNHCLDTCAPTLFSNPKQPGTLEFPTLIMPHPLTGVACDIQECLAKIGTLVRRNRRRVHDGRLDWINRTSIQELSEEIEEAGRLEYMLFNTKVRTAEEIANSGDARTPTWHLVKLAEVYRHVGLLLLYRVFSDVRASARRRRSCECLFEDHGFGRNDGDADGEWLRALALRSIAALRSVPIESGTKDFHPFLLVAISSELKISSRERSRSSARNGDTNGSRPHTYGHDHDKAYEDLQGLPPGALDVHAARAFLMSRLQALKYALPGRPIKRCVDIVRAVWEPQGDKECPFWMDVMIQNNWDTFMA